MPGNTTDCWDLPVELNDLKWQPTLRRILLVEDDPDQCLLYRILLTQANYEVVDVPDGEQALLSLQNEQGFGLLLADWGLPGIQGDALIELVKARYRPIRTVLMSNHPDIREVARNCGADAGFFKLSITRLPQLVDKLFADKVLVNNGIVGG
jgi:DNA-binding NtrC family response regulator